jgi:hypothetical protein
VREKLVCERQKKRAEERDKQQGLRGDGKSKKNDMMAERMGLMRGADGYLGG